MHETLMDHLALEVGFDLHLAQEAFGVQASRVAARFLDGFRDVAASHTLTHRPGEYLTEDEVMIGSSESSALFFAFVKLTT